MKHIAILIVVLSARITLSAQSRFPYDSVNHVVLYEQTFKLNPKVKTDDVYAAAQAWFGDVTKFTHKNAIVPLDTMATKKIKRKEETEAQFANPRPLQMQDPAGDRLQGMGIIRYYSNGNSLKMLYIKYDIAVKLKADAATISISNIHYFHYNPASYKQVPIYNFSGGTPCEEVGMLESLIGCENFHDEFKALALYCNKEIYEHIDDFRNLLKQKKYLNESKAAPAGPAKKAPAKAPTKKK